MHFRAQISDYRQRCFPADPHNPDPRFQGSAPPERYGLTLRIHRFRLIVNHIRYLMGGYRIAPMPTATSAWSDEAWHRNAHQRNAHHSPDAYSDVGVARRILA